MKKRVPFIWLSGETTLEDVPFDGGDLPDIYFLWAFQGRIEICDPEYGTAPVAGEVDGRRACFTLESFDLPRSRIGIKFPPIVFYVERSL